MTDGMKGLDTPPISDTQLNQMGHPNSLTRLVRPKLMLATRDRILADRATIAKQAERIEELERQVEYLAGNDEPGGNPNGQFYGKDCPKRMVQVEFVGCSPANRVSAYGWKPEKSAFLEVYVEGQRFRIDVGHRRLGENEYAMGLHINHPFNVSIENKCLNAFDLLLPERFTLNTDSEGG